MSSKSRQTKWFRLWSEHRTKQILPSGLMEYGTWNDHSCPIGRSFAFKPFSNSINNTLSTHRTFHHFDFVSSDWPRLSYILNFTMCFSILQCKLPFGCKHHCVYISLSSLVWFEWKLSKHAHNHRLLLLPFWFVRLFWILFLILFLFFLFIFLLFVKTFTHRSD